MGFNIGDLEDRSKILFINFWNWRPTVELIRSFGVIDSERLALMQDQCTGVKVVESEARLIGQKLQEYVSNRLQEGERLRLDLSITPELDDHRFHKGENFRENYSASTKWLTQFATFCSECRGFNVN